MSANKRDLSDFLEGERGDIYYSKLLRTSFLPADHKPARGRGRSLQLSKMTEEQVEEEKLLRLEKNRLAAKDSRMKKKRKLNEMQERIQYLENIISKKDTGYNFLKELKKKDERIEILEEVLHNQSTTIQRLLEREESN